MRSLLVFSLVALFAFEANALKANGKSLNKHILKSYGNGMEGTFFDYELQPSTFTSDGNKFEDGRRLGFNLTYNSDLEVWLNWERNDIIEHQWFADNVKFHTFMFFEISLNIDLFLMYFKVEVPFKVFDVGAADIFFLYMPESKIFCTGGESYWKLFDVEPVVKENVADCTYSLLSRFTGKRAWWDSSSFANMFECRGTTTESGTFFDTSDNAHYVEDLPLFNYDFTGESLYRLPYFDFTFME